MAAVALIRFSQGARVGAAGQALVVEEAGGQFFVENGGDNTDVKSWRIELLYGPPGSASERPPGAPSVLGEDANGSIPSAPYLPEINFPGCYRCRLTVYTESNFTGVADVDIRNVATLTPNNAIILPPFQKLPDPLPLEGTGQPGQKPDEMNFEGQPWGWSGPDYDHPVYGQQFAQYRLVNAALQLVDTGGGGGGGDVTGAANVGGGTGDVFRDKAGTILNFRSLVGVNGATVQTVGDTIEFDPGTAAGQFRYLVGPPTSNAPYNSIQAAHDAIALAAEGPAAIPVLPGTYVENVTISYPGTSIHGLSSWAPGVTVLQGDLTYTTLAAGARHGLSELQILGNLAVGGIHDILVLAREVEVQGTGGGTPAVSLTNTNGGARLLTQYFRALVPDGSAAAVSLTGSCGFHISGGDSLMQRGTDPLGASAPAYVQNGPSTISILEGVRILGSMEVTGAITSCELRSGVSVYTLLSVPCFNLVGLAGPVFITGHLFANVGGGGNLVTPASNPLFFSSSVVSAPGTVFDTGMSNQLPIDGIIFDSSGDGSKALADDGLYYAFAAKPLQQLLDAPGTASVGGWTLVLVETLDANWTGAGAPRYVNLPTGGSAGDIVEVKDSQNNAAAAPIHVRAAGGAGTIDLLPEVVIAIDGGTYRFVKGAVGEVWTQH